MSLNLASALEASRELPLPRVGSEVHLDEWVSPDMADEYGYLRAGNVLEWMDVVGGLAASRHCRRDVATASVDALDLVEPIAIGERVTMKGSVAYTSERSVGISISLEHAGRQRSAASRQLSGYMTFVSLDENGYPLPVAAFTPETAAEEERFREGALRREFRRKLQSGGGDELLHATPMPRADKQLFLRELFKELPSSVRMPWELYEARRQRPRHSSYIHKIEPVRAGALNFHGTLYGGILMRWIETTANLSARAFLDGRPVRFTGLHGLSFIKPVHANLFVHIRTMVVHSGSASMTVLASVQAEDPVNNSFNDTVRAFFTYEPLKSRGVASRVPPLECIGEEERALFEEVEKRLALQRLIATDARR